MEEVSGLLRAAIDRARELSVEADGDDGRASAELSILLFERHA
jgi:hypothetical protein